MWGVKWIIVILCTVVTGRDLCSLTPNNWWRTQPPAVHPVYCTVRNKSPHEVTPTDRPMTFDSRRLLLRNTTGSTMRPDCALSLQSSTHIVLFHMSFKLALHQSCKDQALSLFVINRWDMQVHIQEGGDGGSFLCTAVSPGGNVEMLLITHAEWTHSIWESPAGLCPQDIDKMFPSLLRLPGAK